MSTLGLSAYFRNAVERVTDALKVIDNDHAYVHMGGLVSSYHKFSAVAAAGTRYILIKTPATKYVHYRAESISTSGDNVTIEFFEAPTTTADGTALSANNHRRTAPITAATVTLFHTPTVTADGTLLHQTYIGGGTGTGGNRIGGEQGNAQEWVLARSTNYLIKITNGSAAANTIQVNPLWYEEDDG
jgi:hypothetical protein